MCCQRSDFMQVPSQPSRNLIVQAHQLEKRSARIQVSGRAPPVTPFDRRSQAVLCEKADSLNVDPSGGASWYNATPDAFLRSITCLKLAGAAGEETLSSRLATNWY